MTLAAASRDAGHVSAATMPGEDKKKNSPWYQRSGDIQNTSLITR